MAGGKASAKKVELAKRREVALELKKGGATYREIADAIRREFHLSRYSVGLAYRDVTMALAELKAQNQERAQDLLDLELARLEEMTRAVYQNAIAGDESAIHTMLRIMDRRSTYLKLLLPAPVMQTEQEIETPGGERIRTVTRIVANVPVTALEEGDEDSDEP